MVQELKKRGEVIADLTQSLSDIEKEKSHLFERLNEKENVVLELKAKITNHERSFENRNKFVDSMKQELEDLKTYYSSELNQKTEQLQSLSAELETMSSQIRAREETIASLKTEIKQKDMHGK